LRVHHSTVSAWRSQDAQFDDDLAAAEAEFIQNQVEIIKNAATKGSWQASAWLLERRLPAEFSQPQIQLEQLNQVNVVQHTTTEEFQDLIRRVKLMKSPEKRFPAELLEALNRAEKSEGIIDAQPETGAEKAQAGDGESSSIPFKLTLRNRASRDVPVNDGC
jgi:hypothetical protein